MLSPRVHIVENKLTINNIDKNLILLYYVGEDPNIRCDRDGIFASFQKFARFRTILPTANDKLPEIIIKLDIIKLLNSDIKLYYTKQGDVVTNEFIPTTYFRIIVPTRDLPYNSLIYMLKM